MWSWLSDIVLSLALLLETTVWSSETCESCKWDKTGIICKSSESWETEQSDDESGVYKVKDKSNKIWKGWGWQSTRLIKMLNWVKFRILMGWFDLVF